MTQMTTEQAIQLAVRHHTAGQLPQAEMIYRQILGINPNHPDALHLLGMIAFQTGHVPVAADIVARSLALAPNVSHFHDNFGKIMQAMGRRKEALAAFARAVEIDPKAIDARSRLVDELLNVGEWEAAAENLRILLAHNAQWPEAQSNLGHALNHMSKPEQASRHFREAVRLQPAFAVGFNNLAAVLLEVGLVPESIKNCREAIRLRPDFVVPHSTML